MPDLGLRWLGSRKFEYLDHTADVQLHAWGSTLDEALAQCVVALTGYITDIETVRPDPDGEFVLEVSAPDALGLVFRTLDEALFQFCTEGRLICDASVRSLRVPPITAPLLASDRPSMDADASASSCSIAMQCRSQVFDAERHPSGTEIKAITYSNMMVIPPTDHLSSSVPSEDHLLSASSSTSHWEASSGSSATIEASIRRGIAPRVAPVEDRAYAAAAHEEPAAWHIFCIVDI